MESLEANIKAAAAQGISYGKYKAQTRDLTPPEQKKAPPKKKGPKRRYTDAQALELWKQGKTDTEIGAAVGVSRACIQRWRDNMELPLYSDDPEAAQYYELVETKYGTFIVYEPPSVNSHKNTASNRF